MCGVTAHHASLIRTSVLNGTILLCEAEGLRGKAPERGREDVCRLALCRGSPGENTLYGAAGLTLLAFGGIVFRGFSWKMDRL